MYKDRARHLVRDTVDIPYCCDAYNPFLFPEQCKISKVTPLAQERGPMDPMDGLDASDAAGAADVVDPTDSEVADAEGAAEVARWRTQRG